MMTSTNPTLDGTVQGTAAASDRKCLACDWTGPALATRMFGTLSALCPDCGQQTAPIDCNAEVLEALGVCAIACADTHPELCAGIVAQLAPDNVAVLDPAPGHTEADDEHNAHHAGDEYVHVINAWLIGKNQVTIEEIMGDALKLDVAERTRLVRARIGRSLADMGWKRRLSFKLSNGRRYWIYQRPTADRAAPLTIPCHLNIVYASGASDFMAADLGNRRFWPVDAPAYNERWIITNLLAVASAAWHALDDSEEASDGTHIIGLTDAAALAASLQALDELPDDKPGYTMDGPGRAEWALRALLGQASAPQCTCPSGDGSLNWPCPEHPPAKPGALPSGWKWAPLQATPEMCQAGQASGKNSKWSYANCYRDMLAAAPSPEAAQEGEQMAGAARDVLAERRRQVEAEGYDPAHDDEHPNGEIAAYAAFYAMPPAVRDWPTPELGYGDTLGQAIIPADWLSPKTGDRRQELVKAGALILAAIERMDRALQAQTGGEAKGGAA
jgi:hypothetical protein